MKLDLSENVNNSQMRVSEPLVSVIVPTHNRTITLQRAIDSILNQSYQNFEIVIANDNKQTSRAYGEVNAIINALGDPRIVCVETGGDAGGGRARNIACAASLGTYLAFLDDDDIFLPNKLEEQLSFMLQHDLEMSYQDVEWREESGRLVERRVLDHAAGTSRDDLLRAHLLTPIAPTSIYMMTKDLFGRTGGFGEVSTGQDWYLMLRCIEADGRISYMPGVYVWQYLHQGERVSLGANKIEGEIARHEFVKTYYNRLTKKEIKYVEFRHNAVLAFSSARSKNFLRAAKYALLTVAISPADCLREARRYFSK